MFNRVAIVPIFGDYQVLCPLQAEVVRLVPRYGQSISQISRFNHP